MTTLQSIIDAGELDGYEPGTPLPKLNALVDGAAIDREIVEKTACDRCGGKCEFHPYAARDKSLYPYRAFSVCTQCGEAVEY